MNPCFACMSADRKLYKLVEYRDVFKLICKNIIKGRNSDTLLCFECVALLRNVKKFQVKVQKSQNTLKSCKGDNAEKIILTSLSNLCTTEAYVLDCNNPVDWDNDNEVKDDQEEYLDLKQEDQNHDDNDFDYDVPLAESGNDNQTEINIYDTLFEYKESLNEEKLREDIFKFKDENTQNENVPETEVRDDQILFRLLTKDKIVKKSSDCVVKSRYGPPGSRC